MNQHRFGGPVAALVGAAALVVSCAPSARAPSVRAPSGHASAIIRDTAGATVGQASFSPDASGAVTLDLGVTGLAPGLHGVHLHAVGSCAAAEGNAFGAAGGHFNPLDRSHGLENAEGPHAGDLPNLEVGADGRGRLRATTDRFSLTPGASSLLDPDGAALVVHAGPDDQVSDPAGNSGGRIACGVVTRE